MHVGFVEFLSFVYVCAGVQLACIGFVMVLHRFRIGLHRLYVGLCRFQMYRSGRGVGFGGSLLRSCCVSPAFRLRSVGGGASSGSSSDVDVNELHIGFWKVLCRFLKVSYWSI